MKRSAQHDANQYILPFEAAKDELLAQIRMLRQVDLGLSRGRAEGVLQLLERLILLGTDLREVNGLVRVRAQVVAVAARIQSRNTVSERTVRNWRRDAVDLGLISVDVRSQKWGRREWNDFEINVTEIRKWVAGNGRKWPETISAPRPETISAPRPETISAPLHCSTKGNTTPPQAADTQPTSPTPTPRTVDTRCVSVGAVESVFLKLEVGRAMTLVAEALQRGCDTRSLMAIARWYQRSQRRHPKRWDKPSTVLMIRLTAAKPDLPAWLGWISGTPLPRRHSSQAKPSGPSYREVRAKAQAEYASGPSIKEELAALRGK